MIENLQETTKEIKQRLRLAMNGITSAHQRQSGLNYKINFGVEIPRLKEIAKEYPKNRELATELWSSSVRECKLLALFLLPEEHYDEVAQTWVEQTPFTEIADHLAGNILCKLTDATSTAIKWSENKEGLHRYCAYLTLAHLFRKGASLTAEQEKTFYSRITELYAEEECGTLMQRAYSALCSYIDAQEERGTRFVKQAGESRLAELIKEYIGAI